MSQQRNTLKRTTFVLVVVGTMILCCYEAWAAWGTAGLAGGLAVAVVAIIAGLKAFSP